MMKPILPRFASLFPVHPLKCGVLPLPEVESVVMHTRHDAHSFGFVIEAGVPQKTPHVKSGIIRAHIQPHQSIAAVTKQGIEEILVLREKRHSLLPVQQWNDLGVFDAGVGKFTPDLPEGDAPASQQQSLIIREILVQKIQATDSPASLREDRRRGLFCDSSQASRASRTDSATAASGIRPPQRVLHMNSHDRPSTTSSNTCQTMMRVPLNVGLPWQTSGSATIYWPSSTLWFVPFFTGRIYPSEKEASSRFSLRGGRW
jgi:hypothetical protein